MSGAAPNTSLERVLTVRRGGGGGRRQDRSPLCEDPIVNPLLSPAPDDVVSEHARTHWIDTNVMLEVYSHGDLYFEWALRECSRPPGLNTRANPEGRRVLMQGSLWMAMVLCQMRVSTLTYQHENLRNILRLAPPDSEVGGWTATIVYQLGDGGVFSGWERTMTTSGEQLSDRDRDRLIVRACSAGVITTPIPGITAERMQLMQQALDTIREHTPGPLVLVTRDADLIRRAGAAGVDTADPETFAARTMTRDAARAMFTARLEQAINRYIARGPLHQWLLRVLVTERLRDLYAAIWTPLDQPWSRRHLRDR